MCNINYKKGCLLNINIDGYDGIGKSTLISRYNYLLSMNGISINRFKYPSDHGTIGNIIRKMLLDDSTLKDKLSEEELYAGNLHSCAFILDRWFIERGICDSDYMNINPDTPILVLDRSKYSNMLYYIMRRCKLSKNFSPENVETNEIMYRSMLLPMEPPSRSIFEINVALNKNASYKEIGCKDNIEEILSIEDYNQIFPHLFSDKSKNVLNQSASLIKPIFIKYELNNIEESDKFIPYLDEEVEKLHDIISSNVRNLLSDNTEFLHSIRIDNEDLMLLERFSTIKI